MEASTGGRFEHLREHSIGLPQVLFQSITHMAPAAAVAYSIFISVPYSQQALPLSVGLALIACICAATAIGQLAKRFPSAGGMYTYTAKTLGPWAGFLVAWLFILFEPLVAPFLYLEFGWAMSDVFQNSIGWHYSGQWWIWVVLMTVIVFLLTYRDIRLSTTAGVILGAFEILIFGALALWMIFSNTGHLNLQPFNPHHAAGAWSGVFKGMVFAILAFIGFEASAPLGEEAKNPRRTVPRAVVGSAIAIGIFYVLCSYAWVFGAGFDSFVKQATTNPDPWRSLAKIFWGGGWVLVFLAICNSIAANSNAAVNAATRVFYSLARNGLAPKRLGHVHERFRTPDVAIIGMSVFALVLSLLFGWKWGALVGFSLIATIAVPVVIVVYMLVCAGCIRYYLRDRRDAFNPFLHLLLPIGGIVLFFFPLYYQFYSAPPTYPIKYANWVAAAWTILGIILTVWISMSRPDKLEDMERVYVDDEGERTDAWVPTPA
ncbi:MAG: APC family permease [Actinobacteria bacterium]|nr:APC family permease [Actinomycetota bacterium]MBV8561879.1 APC family permease [Actinomycetota bacterium]